MNSLEFLTLLFFFIVTGLKFSYFSMINNINLTVGEFVQFEQYRVVFTMVTNLDCAVILLFLYTAISHIASLSEDLRVIARSLKNVRLLLNFMIN